MRQCLKPLLCILILYFRSSNGEQKCTSYKTEIMKRSFYFEESYLPFRIEMSRRISHQLVSHIARILLKEALGYQHVVMIEQDTDNATRTLQKISSCKEPGKCEKDDVTGPELMINLELWLSPGFNLESWISTHRIEDCGPLGPIGRAGWFIEKRVVDLLWQQNGTVIDHYRAFLNTEVTASFDLTSDSYVIEKANKTCKDLKERSKEFGCGADGFYRPPQCINKTYRCATILSDYPESTFVFLKGIIETYELLVNIAWLGNDFEKALLDLIADTKAVDRRNILFYHRKPMMLSSITNITHVTFPGCEDDKSKCEFEVNQLQKVVWSEVKKSAPHAFYLIRHMTFKQKEYKQLLNTYHKKINRNQDLPSVACDWVKDNEFIWTNWIPADAQNKTSLYIGGIFPIEGVYWNQRTIVEAAKMATKAINKNASCLIDYHLELTVSDGSCATDEVMKSYINYLKSDHYKRTIGILGPACSDTVEPIAGVAKHFNTIIISYSAEGTLFNSQEKYRFFFRTIPENILYKYVFIKVFKKLGYTRMAALTEEGQKYPEYISYLQDLMKTHKMTFIENKKFPRETSFDVMATYLEDLKKKGAKIIIGEFYDYAARSVMCHAFHQRMTSLNGYLWFLPSWFPSDWYDTDTKNYENNESVNCTTAQMREAINGHMSLSFKTFADDDQIMQENITVYEWRKNYEKQLIAKQEPSKFAGYAYDAVWLYAIAIDRLFGENESHVNTLHSDRTSKRLVQLLRETKFNGVSGPLFFQNGGSRMSDVQVLQWVEDKTLLFQDKYRLIGLYKPTKYDDGDLELFETSIFWISGHKPDDGSKEYEDCAVESLRKLLGVEKCETAKIIANVIGVSGFAVIVCIVIIIYKRRYDKRLKNTEKRFKELGLLAIRSPVDEWELSRDRIVINRKLGEGCFGSVYGGEALVGNKGWIPVAVKTLKRGSKIEDKLDFLGEAEIMKKFDHVNIVKLVGVCTTEEPVYTVMEFMLYGDLKTYLLGRRNMATEKERWKNEEVSDRRLTNMAMDIARGLSYLADQKYIHRDLACRNCLVNTSRSVKIADFGMCRKMYDQNYYRYTKKGMLPVRWMAPESLISFIYTPMSDVWSYGVVLYEIITFGGIPYLGLPHEEVLAHIRSHRTLPVPKGCKPELESLLHRCWSKNPEERPKAAEIVEYLARYPELITPCLDVPASSLALESTDVMDFKTFERARGHSFSSVWQSRKSFQPLDPTSLEIDTAPVLQSSHDPFLFTKHSAFKHPSKKSFHESFKKAKRDLRKDRNTDFPPQITYL